MKKLSVSLIAMVTALSFSPVVLADSPVGASAKSVIVQDTETLKHRFTTLNAIPYKTDIAVINYTNYPVTVYDLSLNLYAPLQGNSVRFTDPYYDAYSEIRLVDIYNNLIFDSYVPQFATVSIYTGTSSQYAVYVNNN